MRFFKLFVVALAVVVIATAGLALAGETLDAVKKRGYVIAGVNGGVKPFQAYAHGVAQ